MLVALLLILLLLALVGGFALSKLLWILALFLLLALILSFFTGGWGGYHRDRDVL